MVKAKKIEMMECSECDALVREEDIQEIDAYKSADMGEISRDSDDLVEAITAYECPECQEISESKDDLFSFVDAYECGECGEIHRDKEDAKQCCKD
jgi:Zn ribbon nucleic-acid-binding protein